MWKGMSGVATLTGNDIVWKCYPWISRAVKQCSEYLPHYPLWSLADVTSRPDPLHRVHPAARTLASVYRNRIRSMEGVQFGGFDNRGYLRWRE